MPTTSKAVIKHINSITEDIKEYILVPDKYTRFEEGQFLQLAFGELNAYDIWPDSRAFSIASPYDNEKKEITIIVKNAGQFSARMSDNLCEGNTVTIRYPFGDFYIEEGKDNLVLIAAGTGVTPFLSYIGSEKYKEYKGNVFLFYTAKTLSNIIHYEESVKISEENPKFKLHIFLTAESTKYENINNKRMSVDDVLGEVRSLEESKFYICGPVEFIHNITSQLNENKINNVYSEIWE